VPRITDFCSYIYVLGCKLSVVRLCVSDFGITPYYYYYYHPCYPLYARYLQLYTSNKEEREVYRFLVGKPEGRRPLGRPRRRWVDNIRMDLQEVGCGYMDWIGLAQDRDRWGTLVKAVMNLRVP